MLLRSIKFLIVFVLILLVFLNLFFISNRHLSRIYFYPEIASENVHQSPDKKVHFVGVNKSEGRNNSNPFFDQIERTFRFTPEESHRFRARRQKLEEFCKRNEIRNNKVFPRKKLWIYHKYKINGNTVSVTLKWCPIFKAASTPLFAILSKVKAALTPRVEAQIRRGQLTFLDIARRFRFAHPNYHEETSFKVGNTSDLVISLLLVRHPFSRLVSAFRDKLERRSKRDFYFRSYGQKIQALFPDTKSNPQPPGSPPTFLQFVQYLLATHPDSWDEHWSKSKTECSPCTTKPDLILLADSPTFDAEIQTLFDKVLRLTPKEEYQRIWNRWANRGHQGQSGGQRNITSSSELTREYFKGIPRRMVENLAKIFRDDFEMFGYSTTIY